MTNREKAIRYMRDLNLLKCVEKNFKKGKLMQSCGGRGILFYADERQRERAAELETEYCEDHSVVWHIISDTIMMGDDAVKLEAYLIVDDTVLDTLMIYDGKYSTYVYVDNLTIPEYSEYGETIIGERAGGLARIG